MSIISMGTEEPATERLVDSPLTVADLVPEDSDEDGDYAA